MKIKNLFVLGMFLVGILALSGIASALDISQVKLDGDALKAGDNYIEKNDEYEVKVIFDTGNESYEDVQITAYLRGDKHDDKVEDTTDSFDVESDTQYVKKLNLELPLRMENDEYTLYVRIEDRKNEIKEDLSYSLKVRSLKNAVYIRDIDLSPSNGVKAGRALLATVRVQNRGTTDEEDVKVTFSIPDLGISASDYIDELAEDGEKKDSKSTEELYLRVPSCVEEGVYEGIVEVRYDDGDEVTKQSVDIEVIADETCEVPESSPASSVGKTIISIGPESQDVTKAAGGVVYPVTVTNAASGTKTYTIVVTGADWGTFKVSPSNVITVGSDETKSAYIYVSANDNAAVGEQVFSVAINSGDKEVKEVTLKANVVEGKTSVSLKRALEIGLIVLVVILVILGLIIGFNKLKGEDEDKEEGQSYY